MMLWLLVALLVPEATVKEVVRLDRAAVEKARAAGLPAQIAALVRDGETPLPLRLHGARALGRLGGGAAVAALGAVAVASETPEAVALAREAAKALKQLRAYAAVAPAMASADPEVRAFAASAGGEAACGLLKSDPWPMVRAAAAAGLRRGPAKCLAVAFGQPDARVVTAAAASAIEARDPALRTPLRKLAGKADAPTEARAHAFVALAHLNDLEPATKALAAHLDKGAIEPLALAAIRAFSARGQAEDGAQLVKALESESVAVVQAAARALLILGTADSRAAVAAQTERASGRLKAALQQLQAEFAPSRDLGDPAAADPE